MLAVGTGIAFGTALIVYYIVSFLVVTPPVVAATPQKHLTLQTVPAFGHPPHADWVSFLAQEPDGKWVHSTVLSVPAYSTITVTIYNFDTATGLRNPFWGQPRGTIGGTMQVNGKTLNVLDPSLASHTFTIPDLGVDIALRGIPDSQASKACAAAPCGSYVTTDWRLFPARFTATASGMGAATRAP